MKRVVFAAGVLGLAFAASSPARADFAVVKFETGFCRVWWDSAANPAGPGWTKIALGLPDYQAAWAAMNLATMQGVCR